MNTKNQLKKNLLALAVASAILTGTPAYADETTGTVRGAVVNSEATATVKIIDNARGITRQAEVVGNEDFRFGNLIPGSYTLQVFADGELVDTRPVVVTLGGTSTVLFGEDLEEVVVTGQRISRVDMGVADSGLVISAEELIALPIARDLTSVTLLAPSVSRGDRSFGKHASFSGASVAENVSYINGLNTTNFRNGLGFSKVPFEFYDNIQVKTGGYSAKFGRSTGGVMNATTKSGSNEFDFGASFYYDQDLRTVPDTYAANNTEDVSDSTAANIYASGPIIEDRLFFFALYSNDIKNEENYGMTSGRGFKEKTESDFWGIKLDGYITEDHRVEFTAFSDERDEVEGVYTYDSETNKVSDFIGNNVYTRGGLNWIASYIGNITDDLTLTVSYGENELDRSSVPDNSHLPAVQYLLPDGSYTDQGDWVDVVVEEGIDTRKMYRVDLAWSLGYHFVEVGLDIENNSLTENTRRSGDQWWQVRPTKENKNGDIVPEAYSSVYRNVGGFKTDSNAFYIQDAWDITNNFTIQAGLRNETFTNYSVEGEAFIDVGNQWAPRFSFTLDPTGSGRQKIYGNAGMYYMPVATNTNVRLGGSEFYHQTVYKWDGECQNDDYTPCNLGEITSLSVLATGDAKDTRSLVNSNIEPMYQSEYILGYEYIADSNVKLGVRGIYRNLEVSLEDVAIDAAVIDHYNNGEAWDNALAKKNNVECRVDPDCTGTVEQIFGGFHQYVLTNPGSAMEIYIPEMEEYISLSPIQLGYPEAQRQYAAVEFTVKRPFDGKWSMDASYTWGHSWGNNEGYVRSDNAQTDSGLTTNFDQPGLTDGAYGNLPNDRRHTIKAYGMYEYDMGLSIGANFIWQTGRPKNCFGVHPTDGFAGAYGNSSFYCQGESTSRGSQGRTPNYWSLDLKAQYTVNFMDDKGLLLSLNIENILNNKAVLETQELGDQDGRYPQPVNPLYGKAIYFQDPTRISLAARYDF